MGPSETVNLAVLEKFHLDRLARFSRLSAEAESSGVEQWRRLAVRATLSAYRDCVASGLEVRAREILGGKPPGEPTPA